MPFPSLGCQTCKNRRIKCDATRPICNRCKKSQRICYGMKEAGSVVHIENAYASGLKKRPRGPRPTSASEASDTTSESPQPIGLERPLKVDLQSQAVAYFMHHFLESPANALVKSRGIPDEVMALCEPTFKSTMLEHAVSSLALAIFARKLHHPPAAVEASVKYHQLLQIMQATLPSLDETNIDACLVSIFLMSRYEDAKARPDGRALSAYLSFSHHDGTAAALRTWKFGLSGNGRGDVGVSDVIKHSRRGTIRSALLRNIAVPEWLQDGSAFGEYGLELDYDRVSIRIVNLRLRLASLLKSPLMSNKSWNFQDFGCVVEELDEEARGIDEALQLLSKQIPLRWSYHHRTLSVSDKDQTWPRKGFYSSTVYIYNDPAHAAIWILYFATRMLINSTRLRILNLKLLSSSSSPTHSPPHSHHQFSSSNINTMALNLASSLPYCLQRLTVAPAPSLPRNELGDPSSITAKDLEEGDIEPHVANQVIWPLSIASSLADVEPGLLGWLRAELAGLGSVVCAGVLESAEGGEWFEL